MLTPSNTILLPTGKYQTLSMQNVKYYHSVSEGDHMVRSAQDRGRPQMRRGKSEVFVVIKLGWLGWWKIW